MRHFRLLLCTSCALLELLACGPRAREAPPSLLLVSIDTLRADHLGAYGYPRATSPHIDALARRGVLFEDASSPAPWTVPAHASLLTGRVPVRHGVKAIGDVLPASLPTLASRLRDRGYRTGAAVNIQFLKPKYGVTRGFERHVYVEEAFWRRRPTRELTNQALAWLAEPGAPQFLFLHYYDVHSDYASLPRFERLFVSPYTGELDGTTEQLEGVRDGEESLDEADRAHLVDLYDAGIRQMDAEIGRLLEALRDAGLEEHVIVVLTSDHGEEFLEHGSVLHGRSQFREMLWVPLILAGPGVPAGVRVRDPVSLVDVAPTLLELAGAAPDPSGDGRSLAPLWNGAVSSAERVLVGEADWRRTWQDETRAVRRGRYVLHTNRRTQQHALYDLESDPGETRDVSAAHPARVEDLLAELARYESRAVPRPSGASPTDEERASLESLGYAE